MLFNFRSTRCPWTFPLTSHIVPLPSAITSFTLQPLVPLLVCCIFQVPQFFCPLIVVPLYCDFSMPVHGTAICWLLFIKLSLIIDVNIYFYCSIVQCLFLLFVIHRVCQPIRGNWSWWPYSFWTTIGLTSSGVWGRCGLIVKSISTSPPDLGTRCHLSFGRKLLIKEQPRSEARNTGSSFNCYSLLHNEYSSRFIQSQTVWLQFPCKNV